MDLGLDGATAVVTGGSKGMGRAVAEALAAEGARVAVMARGRDALDATVDALWQAGARECVGITADFADAASVTAAFEEIGARWDALNVLVHTVGPGSGTFESLDDAGWEDAFGRGTLSAVRAVRCALPLLRRAEWARVCTFGAVSVRRPNARTVAYSAAKAALANLTKNLSKTLAPEGILVNCVCPGTIVTASFTEALRPVLAAEGLDSGDPVAVMEWIGRTFHESAGLGRAGLPEEVAALAAFLVSRRNGYVTGATVNADGGSDFY
ncbi:SDR family NAD(P)-dependent oxidoreductase [Actinocorallia longicatena]|uniref:SDR family oxidoreductase n=1 Tax=Actinocorallia longicatena TaxID=111803 RepID=A0ABP6Q882_9ACTN